MVLRMFVNVNMVFRSVERGELERNKVLNVRSLRNAEARKREQF